MEELMSLSLTTTLAAELGHNTSASSAYNKANIPANFTGETEDLQNGPKVAVNSLLSDDSYNPVTPCHVSNVSVRTLFPGYAGPIISQLEPYDFGGNHVDIGVNTNSAAWAKAVCEDEQQRGVDGVTVDWYGPNRYEDDVTLLLKAQIESMVGFTFAIMIDTSGGSYSTTAELEACLAYLNTTYFSSKAYQKFNGKNILILWGTPVAGVNYTQALAPYASSLYVITQGLSVSAWTNARFDWVQPFLNGVSETDPYNLAGAKQAFVNGVKGNTALGCLLAVSPGFNGYLTKTEDWSLGKMLPRNFGACWLAQAKFVAANLLPNLVFVWLVTGCGGDWEEGSQIGSAIDNGISVTSSLKGSVVSWVVSGGTGDETTISSYNILVQQPGSTPFDTAVIPAQDPGGSKTFDLSTISGWTPNAYQVYVQAVGKPCIRNQVSAAMSYTPILTGTFVGTFDGIFTGTFTPST